MATPHPLYTYRVNDYSSSSGWTTDALFDGSFTEAAASAIDTFYQKSGELNVLILDPRDFRLMFQGLRTGGRISPAVHNELETALSDTTSIKPVFSNLVLLGYISAVESYIREILRRVITIDSEARRACEAKSISYGAALFHTPLMLPEALLEQMSFISRRTIEDTIREFVGIVKVQIPKGISDILIEYENVCQLRHCIVHRFGKLGANNAIKLGLDLHSSFIEKPIKLDYAGLQRVAAVCSNLVKEVNQFLWEYVMMRLIAEPANQTKWKKKNSNIPWSWDFRRDKAAFKKYFDTFAFTGSATNIPRLADAYDEYRKMFRAFV